MVAHVRTVAFQGVKVLNVKVQVQITSGLPAFNIVGLPDKAVGESRERIRAAFHAIGLALPAERITVNMAPADVQKEGSHYDLPVALGLLVCMGVITAEDIENCIALGELGLDGSLARINGILPTAMHAVNNEATLICPAACGAEAAWAGDLQILAAPNLIALINHFKGEQHLPQPEARKVEYSESHVQDLRDVKGQETAKRALEVAAAGGHNMIMTGPPGAGKSMLASRLPGILPPLVPAEALEITMIHSIAGSVPEGGLVHQRPYRDPHHSASLPALVGGGLRCKPGEISLAHNGVLFLDELPEFAAGTLESLRQPLETGQIVVARANAHVTYPARIQLIAAMNPCRCGYYGDGSRECSRVPRCAQDYQGKISGPLLDRFDLCLDVPEVKAEDLSNSNTPRESSKDVAKRVLRARRRQQERYAKMKLPETTINAHINGEVLDTVAQPDAEGKQLLNTAADKLKLSARGYHRVLKLARTLADMEDAANVSRPHIAEALSYRKALPG